MVLYIAGINHNDPLGREKLRRWLKRLADTKSGPPAFVATEWDESLFAEVKRQRSRFRQLAQTEWPDAPSELLDVLELSLGYEGDTHTEFFPSVEHLWLDAGRQGDVSRYAEERLNIYREPLLPTDVASALAKLCEEAWQLATSWDPDRSSKFARLIRERIARGGGDWAIAIVGASHASDNQGSMRRLLEAEGQLCEVTILRSCGGLGSDLRP